ncbi:hypothetical protein MNBD_NITROSPINAE04-246 [hydrothermal vent metagenome]|uniref:Uncharacterized protein n=1 Tax=hydrothermal vent metagenome TaxID=652676 RepID=A0A3B1BS94_9ZZZZ
MQNQNDVIKRIDRDSEAVVKALPEASSKNRGAIVFCLIVLPMISFLRSIAPGGSRSIYDSINAAVLEFVTEAKRYENMYSDKIKPVQDSRDFY